MLLFATCSIFIVTVFEQLLDKLRVLQLFDEVAESGVADQLAEAAAGDHDQTRAHADPRGHTGTSLHQEVDQGEDNEVECRDQQEKILHGGGTRKRKVG